MGTAYGAKLRQLNNWREENTITSKCFIKHLSVLLDKVLLQGDQFDFFNCLNTVYKYCFEDCIKIVA